MCGVAAVLERARLAAPLFHRARRVAPLFHRARRVPLGFSFWKVSCYERLFTHFLLIMDKMAVFTEDEGVEVNAPYNIMNSASVMFDLIRGAHEVQQALKIAWIESKSIISSAVRSGIEEPLLLNEGGGSTVIPDYASYRILWVRSFHPNPVEWNWWDFNLYNPGLSGYLSLVTDALEAQLLIWGGDKPSQSHAVFRLMTEFYDILQRLRMFQLTFIQKINN